INNPVEIFYHTFINVDVHNKKEVYKRSKVIDTIFHEYKHIKILLTRQINKDIPTSTPFLGVMNLNNLHFSLVDIYNLRSVNGTFCESKNKDDLTENIIKDQLKRKYSHLIPPKDMEKIKKFVKHTDSTGNKKILCQYISLF